MPSIMNRGIKKSNCVRLNAMSLSNRLDDCVNISDSDETCT